MKLINLDEPTKEALVNKFKEYLTALKTNSNAINFTAVALNSTDMQKIIKPTVYVTKSAYLKMMLYVRDTRVEIAWHGTVQRSKTDPNVYLINDVFLYPQKLASATVTTDQAAYNKWIEELDDDTVNNMRFQGHSHVNMAVTPSGTDLSYYEDILQTLPKNDYYIFTIMNKSGDMTLLLYDLSQNVIFETADITFKVATNIDNKTVDLIETIKTDKEKYCTLPLYDSNKYFNDDFYDYYKRNKTKPTAYEAYCQEKMESLKQIRDSEPKTDDIFDEIDKKYTGYQDATKNLQTLNKKKKKK